MVKWLVSSRMPLGEVLACLASSGLHANFLDCEAMRLRLAVDDESERLEPLLATLEEAYGSSRSRR